MDSRQAELFRILGVESRIKIIELLKQKGAMGSNEISEAMNITPSAVSQHLKVLKNAGLVRRERKGYWIPYEIAPDALEECNQLLSEVCTCRCKGTGNFRQRELDQAQDKVSMLKKYEEELQKELERVRSQLAQIKEE